MTMLGFILTTQIAGARRQPRPDYKSLAREAYSIAAQRVIVNIVKPITVMLKRNLYPS